MDWIRRYGAFTWAAFVLSIISVLISSYTLVLEKRIDADWATILVAILALLVTILITWQIFNIINLRELTREVKDTMQKIFLDSDVSKVELYNGLSDFYYHLLVKEDIKNITAAYIRCRVITIVNASSAGNYDLCSAIVRTIKETVVADKVILSAFDKDIIFKELALVKNSGKISGYNDMVHHLSSIKTV